MTVSEANITREVLEGMKQKELRALAAERFGMSFPAVFKNSEMIDQILLQAGVEDSDDQDGGEVFENGVTPLEPQDQLVTESGAVVHRSEEPEIVPVVPETPAELPEGESIEGEKKPEFMDREALAAKLAAHRERLSADEAARNERAASVKRYQPWQPTTEEVVKRSGKLAYQFGMLLSAMARIQKETRVLDQVLEAMGELADADTFEQAKRAAVDEFAHVQNRMRFPSPAIASTKQGEELREALWSEILACGIPFEIARRLGDQDESVSVDWLTTGEEQEGDEE